MKFIKDPLKINFLKSPQINLEILVSSFWKEQEKYFFKSLIACMKLKKKELIFDPLTLHI